MFASMLITSGGEDSHLIVYVKEVITLKHLNVCYTEMLVSSGGKDHV